MSQLPESLFRRSGVIDPDLRWYTAKVTTCAELDHALTAASLANNGAYIEVVTDAYAASPLALKLHDSLRTLYKDTITES